ncbi:uncharacterized protein ARMOST_21714 [Armillaria ostoyae]|uniref:Uncharacterized protein n=1 Tax=Armillaria ostoyae TaxID=47428 RepID=A0A284SAW1_ARMOS|nr:uncharacterized protein ARMOST_21714 [Armillaria ostoyae]
MSSTASTSAASAAFNAQTMLNAVGAVGDASQPASLQLKAQARHLALQGAGTVEDLIARIPSDFREALRAPLRDVESRVTKREAVKQALAKIQASITAGKVLPSMKVASQAPQLTSHFAASKDGQAQVNSLDEARQEYETQLGNLAKIAKEKELIFLDNGLQLKSIGTAMGGLLAERYDFLKSRYVFPTFGRLSTAEGTEVPDSWGIIGWGPSAHLLESYQEVTQDVCMYAYIVINRTEARLDAARVKVDKKKQLAATADVEMADSAKPGPSLQKIVADAVKQALAKQASGSGKKTNTPKEKKGKVREIGWQAETLATTRGSKPQQKQVHAPKKKFKETAKNVVDKATKGKGKGKGK